MRATSGPRAAGREQRLTDRLFRPWQSAIDRAAQAIGLQLTPAQRRRVAHEQMRMVLLHTRVGTLAASGFALLLVLHLLDTAPQDRGGISDHLLHGWLALKLLVAALRIGVAQAGAGLDSAHRRWPLWQRAMLGLLALDGAVWGLAGWALMATPVALAALGVAALDGVACVATFGLQVRLAATATYVLPILLPMALGLALRGDEVARFASAGQLLLALLTLLTARATARQLTSTLLLRLQTEQLVVEKDAALRLAHAQSAERSRFLAKVSHELRTPLHGMLGLTRLLQREIGDPGARHRLTLIDSSGQQLLGLIDDLLDVSRIDAGQFRLRAQDFDLAARVAQIAELFRPRAAEKGLAFALHSRLPRPHWVRGDPARLGQVLDNLLGNAVKFTRQGSIALEVGPGAAPDRVCFTVQDSGEGIAEADLLRVFEPFQQAGNGGQTGGVGLGLTIAREIALAMDGDIQVRSAPGQGACFTLTVRLPQVAGPAPAGSMSHLPTQADTASHSPAQADSPSHSPAQAGTASHSPAQAGSAPQPPAPAGAAPSEAAAAPHRPRLVLVAEDDAVSAMVASAYLAHLGLRCELVTDGRQAVDSALRAVDRPELVLMDCRMPELDGPGATAEIRRQERLRGLARLPILALTATASAPDRQSCLAAGMDAVIAKPFSLDQLALALDQAWPPGAAAPASAPSGPSGRAGLAG